MNLERIPTRWRLLYPIRACFFLNFLPALFYPSYIQTYVERDVRQIVNLGNLHQFQRFMRWLPAVSYYRKLNPTAEPYLVYGGLTNESRPNGKVIAWNNMVDLF